MKITRFAGWIALSTVTAGCLNSSDPLEVTAMRASRLGTAAGDLDSGRTTAGLEAGSRAVEEYYLIAKYEATIEQRRTAEATARRGAPALKKTKRSRGASPKKQSRYIAVKTKSDRRAQSKTSVMVWDTQSQEIVGNNVYDLNTDPPAGTVVKFETYSAEYVGVGG